MAYSIYEGVWIDRSMGRLRGATITLSSANGALLLAFIATFITLVSIRLWRILSFMIHQTYATHKAHDGLHFQRQHTLRNTSSPAAAAKMFFLQLWYWRQTRMVVLRTLPWALFSLAYIGVFAVLAVFSSRVSDGASTSRLVLPEVCGVWAVNKSLSDDDRLQVSMEKGSFDAANAAGTAQSCYATNATSLSCNTSPVPMLPSDSKPVACPFGDDICFDGKAFEVKTKPIDSRAHLGINARSEDRVTYDRVLTCAPLVSKNYGKLVLDAAGDPDRVEYFYGPQPPNGTDTPYTYMYPIVRYNSNISYHVNIYEHRTTSNQYWLPINALNLTGGDIFLIFLEQNNVLHWKPNKDPVFGANKPNTNDTKTSLYRADRYVSPIACHQKHRFCNPNNNVCSVWNGRFEAVRTIESSDVNFNPAQLAAASRIVLASLMTSMNEAINSRASKCLRAQDKMDWLFQVPLPDNQWEIEVLAWAHQGLASLQAAVQEYTTGPTLPLEGGFMQKITSGVSPEVASKFELAVDQAWGDMCGTQIVHDNQGTINFSLLGVAIVFGMGIFITIFSFTIEPLTAWVQRKSGLGVTRAEAWHRDDNLHTLRLLFETHQRGTWKGSSDLVPVTVHPNEVFFYPEADSHGMAREVYQSVPTKGDERSA
ncbi:hypothetical protein CC86DRAFT_280419 [Ophiobolus disseminans]|uniref:Uncharacterized protein n=1 Tax=Ophiobolus disseminans TaxID=1469910 RepID=A0A6A7AIV1_9PLEO|nr:hypothetical protein CC86DRAFT_280419 [Ophiobolus disseminans]